MQLAISGAAWLPEGWSAVRLLLLLAAAKIFASSLTIGSGGSAGDFAPSLAIGGLFGGAFGRAAQLLLHDPRLDPGAFALVGMGAFYGGIGHVPLSALVLVCELAGNYDLLVPLMLALTIAVIALRERGLYHAQAATLSDSPVHQGPSQRSRAAILVQELLVDDGPFVTFELHTPAAELLRRLGDNAWQDVFPVVDPARQLLGIIDASALKVLALELRDLPWAVASDVMRAPVSVRPGDELRTAAEVLLRHRLREVPVVDDAGRVVGFLDEARVAEAYLSAAASQAPVQS